MVVSDCVRPFIASAVNVFQTMVELPLQPGTPTPISSGPACHDTSAIIGLSGDVVGVVILGLPTPTAEKVVEKFTGSAMEVGSESFVDALGELVNMVAGSAKAKFDGKTVSISCPSVICGSCHTIALPRDAIGVSIPFNSACGPFFLEFSLKMSGSDAGSAAAPAATGAGATG